MPTTYYHTIDGEILGETTAGVRTDYMKDALGSVTGTTVNGVVQNTYRWKPYGGLLVKTGTAADPKFQWNGGSGYRATQRVHSDCYVRASHYGSAEGQWASTDQVWPSQPAFAYAGCRPGTVSDPSGAAGKCKATKTNPKPFPTPSRCDPHAAEATNIVNTFCTCIDSQPQNACVLQCIRGSACSQYAINAQKVANCMQNWCSEGTFACCSNSACGSDTACACAPASAGPTCTVCFLSNAFQDPNCIGAYGGLSILGHELAHCCGPKGTGGDSVLHACVYLIGECIGKCMS